MKQMEIAKGLKTVGKNVESSDDHIHQCTPYIMGRTPHTSYRKKIRKKIWKKCQYQFYRFVKLTNASVANNFNTTCVLGVQVAASRIKFLIVLRGRISILTRQVL